MQTLSQSMHHRWKESLISYAKERMENRTTPIHNGNSSVLTKPLPDIAKLAFYLWLTSTWTPTHANGKKERARKGVSSNQGRDVFLNSSKDGSMPNSSNLYTENNIVMIWTWRLTRCFETLEVSKHLFVFELYPHLVVDQTHLHRRWVPMWDEYFFLQGLFSFILGTPES